MVSNGEGYQGRHQIDPGVQVVFDDGARYSIPSSATMHLNEIALSLRDDLQPRITGDVATDAVAVRTRLEVDAIHDVSLRAQRLVKILADRASRALPVAETA